MRFAFLLLLRFWSGSNTKLKLCSFVCNVLAGYLSKLALSSCFLGLMLFVSRNVRSELKNLVVQSGRTKS